MLQGKVVFKEVSNVQYVACMNPRAGSFNITPRMQRHFTTFALQMPSSDIIRFALVQTKARTNVDLLIEIFCIIKAPNNQVRMHIKARL